MSWVDLLIIGIFIRGFYLGKKSDVVEEFIKLIGIFIATFIAIHYYLPFSDILQNVALVSEKWKEAYAFAVLAFTIIVIFKVICKGWNQILRVKVSDSINRLASTTLSLVHSYFLCGIIFVGLLISANISIVTAASGSFTRFLTRTTAVSVYKQFYFGIIRQIFPAEPLNTNVFDLVGEPIPELKEKS